MFCFLLRKILTNKDDLQEFYQFTFNYAKNPSQKGLDLEMAVAYWNIVLIDRLFYFTIFTLKSLNMRKFQAFKY